MLTRANKKKRVQSETEQPVARNASSPDVIFREVLRGLYDGQFVPGQRLIESDLTRDFKVSRGSVREALSRLAAEGVVTLTRHRGAYIRRLSKSEVEDVLLLTEVMIGLAARLAAEHIGEPGAETSLRQALKRLLSFKGSPDYFEFVRARNAFYRTLVQICGNRELARVLPSMHVHLVRIQLRSYPTAAERTRFKEYEQIAEAVLAGDATRAERLGRGHIAGILRSLQALPDEAFPDPS